MYIEGNGGVVVKIRVVDAGTNVVVELFIRGLKLNVELSIRLIE
jgi:hypothetical protein